MGRKRPMLGISVCKFFYKFFFHEMLIKTNETSKQVIIIYSERLITKMYSCLHKSGPEKKCTWGTNKSNKILRPQIFVSCKVTVILTDSIIRIYLWLMFFTIRT